jgi:hypothetical protein
MFITLEDETEVANLIVWPSLFERQRQVVLSAGLLACRGRVQREGEVIHLIAKHLIEPRICYGVSASGTSRSQCRTDEETRRSRAAGRMPGRWAGSGASRGTSTSPTCGSGAGSRFEPRTSGRAACRLHDLFHAQLEDRQANDPHRLNANATSAPRT